MIPLTAEEIKVLLTARDLLKTLLDDAEQLDTTSPRVFCLAKGYNGVMGVLSHTALEVPK